jgi:hypothetical protein
MADVKLPSRDAGTSGERAGAGFRSDPRQMTAERSAPMAPRAQSTRSDPKSRPAVFSRGEDGTVTFSSKGDGYLYSFDPATNQFTILESPDGRGVGAKIGADHSMAKNFQEAMGRAQSEAMPASPKREEFPGFAPPNQTDLAESSPTDLERKLNTGFPAPRRFDLEKSPEGASPEARQAYDTQMASMMESPDPFAEVTEVNRDRALSDMPVSGAAKKANVAAGHRNRMLQFKAMRENAARKAMRGEDS